jgi:hypothetical protein
LNTDEISNEWAARALADAKKALAFIPSPGNPELDHS